MSATSILLRCKACKTLNRIPDDKLSEHPVCGQCKAPIDFPREPINVTSASFDTQVQEWPEIVLAEFWAKWCGYCRKIEPFLNGLASRKAGRLKIIRIDVDSEQPIAARFTVKATPTFILYRNGHQIGRFDGTPVREIELEYWIDAMLQKDTPEV